MPDFDVTRSVRAIESLKSDLLSDLAAAYKDMAGFGRRPDFEESFAKIVAEAYLLAGRLGVSFDGLDARAVSLLRIKLLDEQSPASAYGEDIRRLMGHLDERRASQ